MLVLTRLRDEVIMIGDTVSVTVVEVRGNKVRLGFRGPRSVSFHRLEIYESILHDPKNPVTAGKEMKRIVPYSLDQFLLAEGEVITAPSGGMLVLSRCQNEIIVVSSEIRIEVVSINGKKVRLGITAPRDLPVHREEIYIKNHTRSD